VDVLPADLARFVRTVGPRPDRVLAEMERRGDRTGFPTVGPEVGGLLAVLARLTGAERVFEFGSGFGYSAYWVARTLGGGGLVVLTEYDDDELAAAREYFRRGGLADRAAFESGDALDAVERHGGPFDLVLLDHEKSRYRAGFEAVRSRVAPGGVVVADNVFAGGGVDHREVGGLLRGEAVDATEGSRGIADYLRAVRADDAFETVALPLGEGVSVSVRTEP
jgi:predicted O-methyltransferase YrrM